MTGENLSTTFGPFLGRYDHSLDAQGRVSLPGEWRRGDETVEMVMIPTRGPALLLLPLNTFMQFIDKIGKMAISNPNLQMALAYLGSESRRCRCDRLGRMALDRERLSAIGVDRTLTLIGAVTHIRLCAAQNWHPDSQAVEGFWDEIQKAGEKCGNSDVLGLLQGVFKQ